jgi:hypothetical protein
MVGGDVGEFAADAQRQGLAQAGLEMTMRRLDAAVLVADARIVAGRLQAVVVAERPIAGRRVVILAQIAVGRRQPVGAMRRRRPAQLPQRFLRPSVSAVKLSPPWIALTYCQPENASQKW